LVFFDIEKIIGSKGKTIKKCAHTSRTLADDLQLIWGECSAAGNVTLQHPGAFG